MNMSVGKKNKLHWLLLGVLCIMLPASAFADPSMLEYPYIYKSTRAMGMGGAYTAVGGRVDSLFYNPAGLINIPQDKGWEVNLINLSVGYGKHSEQFLKDMQDAFDTQDLNGDGSSDDDQLRAVNDVLAKYRGENLHLRVADFTSIGHSYDRWAFGVGGVGSGRLDALTHQGFGSDGFLEVDADLTYGGLGGVSYGITDNLFGGISVKSLHRDTLVHNFTARELVDNQDNLSDYIQKDLKKSGDATAFDLGVIWKFAPASPLKPTFGASIMNIGDLDFGDAGKLPQTVNVGFAINPAISWSRSLTVAADYIDLFNNFKQDKDRAKRFRFGAELQIFDILPAEIALRAGWYESSPTLGFDVRLLIFTISYAMYTEELGAYAGQDKDKRQILTLDIGW
jgi:hypothetical protein